MTDHTKVYCDSVQCYKKGETALGLQPGDFILTRGKGVLATLISFGQSFRFQGDKSQFAYWNHVALVVHESGVLVEATGQGVKRSHLSDYDPKDYCAVRILGSADDRLQMVKFAEHALNHKYGWASVVALGLSLLSGLKFSFGFDEEMICSGLVAAAQERGWAVFEKPCSHMVPADLAYYYQAIKPS